MICFSSLTRAPAGALAFSVLFAASAGAVTAQSLTVLSSADYAARVVPGSVATVFGTGLARSTAVGAPDRAGRLPRSLNRRRFRRVARAGLVRPAVPAGGEHAVGRADSVSRRCRGQSGFGCRRPGRAERCDPPADRGPGARQRSRLRLDPRLGTLHAGELQRRGALRERRCRALRRDVSPSRSSCSISTVESRAGWRRSFQPTPRSARWKLSSIPLTMSSRATNRTITTL